MFHYIQLLYSSTITPTFSVDLEQPIVLDSYARAQQNAYRCVAGNVECDLEPIKWSLN